MTEPMSNGGITATATACKQGSSSSSSSGISQWSPLSTLERQYKTHQLLLFVKTNANCCIAGGVEYILKQTNKSSSRSAGATATATALSTSAVVEESSSSAAAAAATTASFTTQEEEAASTSTTTTSDPNADPFSFLNETRPEGDLPGSKVMPGQGSTSPSRSSKSNTNANANTSNTQGNKKGGGHNLGRFLKKVAKSTTAHLERGMHNLAIRADQGRNPDLLAAGVYYDNNYNNSGGDHTGNYTLVSLTESCPLPTEETARLQGVAFAIPLVVPTTTTTTTTTTANANATVTVKLWIRSGAALLQQTKAAKNYLIGDVTLNVQQMMQAVQGKGFAVWNVTLQSNLVVNGQLQLLIVKDRKLPALCGRGWSLQDPDPRVYAASPQCLYNLPLHQAYALPYWPQQQHPQQQQEQQQQQPSWSTRATLVATERTVESTVVLPIATAVAQLAYKASQISLQHAQSTLQHVAANRHDKAVGEHALCQIMAGSLLLDHVDTVIANCTSCAAVATGGNASHNNVPRPVVQVFFQKPDSIFEVELTTPTPLPLMETGTPSTFFQAASSCSFFPKPCRQNILPGILQATPPVPKKNRFWLGNVRLQITVPAGFPVPSPTVAPAAAAAVVVPQNPFAPHNETSSLTTAVAPPPPQMSTTPQVWECIVPLDSFVGGVTAGQKQNVPLEYPVVNALGQTVAKVTLVVSLTMEQQQQQGAAANSPISAAGGLVSLMGLRPLMEDILPPMDYDLVASHVGDPDRERRRQQLSTMGYFVTHAFMEQHVQMVRSADALHWKERAHRYWGALQAAMALPTTGDTAMGERVPSNEDRTPRAFRPSSSRSEVLLAGIPFNVHTASLSLDVLDPDAPPATGGGDPAVGATFHNITCGAPADHARGFSNIFTKRDPNGPVTGLNSPVGPVSGGLRRLEAKRAEIASVVMNLEMTLTMSIANYFMEKRQHVKSRPIHHVPPSTAEVADFRWKLYEAVQSLHHVTWACAMRRSIAFSQTLGIAVSSFLSSLSDPVKCQSSWPALWTQHGFLVSFEGLLSAAGKELGMIEDASVGISMLSMVKVVIVSDNGLPEGSIPIPNSPYLKWVVLKPSGANPEVEFTLQIGMAQSYYDQRIPNPLKNGVPVRLYPLLFEVGVDIRQWGAHAGSNMKRNLQESSTNKSAAVESPEPTGGFIDDEDDDVGIPDDDVLVQLNSEAYQKLNAYAHAISPVLEKQKTHPMLATLYQHIVSSAGKINHDIVDEAATLAQQLGGGGVVFCKSGKDRTAMHVTYKQAQFANRFRQQQQQQSKQQQSTENGTDAVDIPDTTLADATMMRVHGTRLPICEKNVGQAKYAFNSLQVKFMPEALKPPMHTLAGFLKGGKVFSGGIES